MGLPLRLDVYYLSTQNLIFLTQTGGVIWLLEPYGICKDIFKQLLTQSDSNILMLFNSYSGFILILKNHIVL